MTFNKLDAMMLGALSLVWIGGYYSESLYPMLMVPVGYVLGKWFASL